MKVVFLRRGAGEVDGGAGVLFGDGALWQQVQCAYLFLKQEIFFLCFLIYRRNCV